MKWCAFEKVKRAEPLESNPPVLLNRRASKMQPFKFRRNPRVGCAIPYGERKGGVRLCLQTQISTCLLYVGARVERNPSAEVHLLLEMKKSVSSPLLHLNGGVPCGPRVKFKRAEPAPRRAPGLGLRCSFHSHP